MGPPKFQNGGQDIIAPVSLDENFKTYNKDPRNPMVFWCQEQYKAHYVTYFAEKRIQMKVESVEDALLQAQSDPDEDIRIFAEKIGAYYRILMLDPQRGQPIDCVYMKDMLFNFILSIRGDYVLDTNMQA